jgi:hypothetical protein
MARHHLVGNVKVPFTAEEEAAFDATEAAQIAAEPMRLWKRDMAETDASLPRINEDIIDSMESTQFDKLPKIARDNHAAKKVLRGQKP